MTGRRYRDLGRPLVHVLAPLIRWSLRRGALFTVEEIREMGRDHPTDGPHLAMANVVRFHAWLFVTSLFPLLLGATAYLRDEVGPGLEPVMAGLRVAVTTVCMFAAGSALINGLRYGPALHYRDAIEEQMNVGRRGAWVRLYSPSNWDTLFGVVFSLFFTPALVA